MKYKFLAFFALSFFVKFAEGQQYTPMTANGYQMKRVKADSTLHLPSFCGVPTLRSSTAIQGALALDTCNNKLYKWTNQAGWTEVAGGGGGSTDTTSLSNRINNAYTTITKLSDTSFFLTKPNTLKDTIKFNKDVVYTQSPIMSMVSNDSNIIYFNADTANAWRGGGGIDSLKRNPGTDSVFAYKSGQWNFQYRDSVGVSGGGGGGGKIYYFNGGVNLGTFGGVTMYELGDTAVTGAAANFTKSTTGNIANFITDAGKPGLLSIPAGVWTIDAYLSETGGGANHAQMYAILEKWNGSTITQIATSPVEEITNGNVKDLYTFAISVPTTTLAITDRIIIQFFIQNTNGKTVTLYTQDGNVGEVHTTFTTGLGALNGLTAPTQTFAVGTSGTDFNISSASSTHTFNLPTASASNRGALSSADWSTFNGKIGASDTSVFQRKNVAAYTFKANNTGSAANMTDISFRQSGMQTYTGTIVFGGTAPSGATNHTYNFTQVGNLVTLNVTLIYATAGTGVTTITLPLPADCPAPKEQNGLGATNDILYYGIFQSTANLAYSNTSRNCVIRKKSATVGDVELTSTIAASNNRLFVFTISYFTN